MGRAQVLMERDFEGPVDWREDTEIAVANIADQIFLRSNPDRLQFTLINLSANPLFIRPAEPATTTTGIRLNANGGSFTVSVKDDAVLPILEWHVVTTVDAMAIYTLEVLGLGS